MIHGLGKDGANSMWNYEKRLQYPINIKETNPKLAAVIVDQLGGPDGELGAALRYLSQRYTMPYKEVSAILTDIGSEELGHCEMISTLMYQLTKGINTGEVVDNDFQAYYTTHTLGVYPQSAGGSAFTAAYFQSKGDPITDLHEDLAAEQKARVTYDNLLRLVGDSDVREPLKFLRAREIVHFQRFGEALRIVEDKLNSKNFYAFNPAFDTNGCR